MRPVSARNDAVVARIVDLKAAGVD